MSNNKKKHQTQVFLSPENYIRQKSRSLPIVKCIVNKNWKEEGIASITVARRHSNGNFTFCSYLVDKYCLGVKDTLFQFNVPQDTFDEYVKNVASNYEIEEISYDLAHNIIFASIEFAEEYGFMPHRDFTSITQYFLEEDTDDIPIIEIQCGDDENGEPLYVNNGYETPALQNRIVSQLKKNAGEGHYKYINADSSLDENYLDDDDDDDDDDDVYYRWYKTFSEMDKDEFEVVASTTIVEWIKNCSNGDSEDDELYDKMRALTDRIAEGNEDICKIDKINEYYNQLLDDLGNINIVAMENVPNSLFPTFESGGDELAADYRKTFIGVYVNSNSEETAIALAKFAEKYKDCEPVAYLKFAFNVATKANKWTDVDSELAKYPDYFMFRLRQIEVETTEMSPEQTREKLLNLVNGRTLTAFEMTLFVTIYAQSVFEMMDLNTPCRLEKLFALDDLLDSEFTVKKCDYAALTLRSMVRDMKIYHIVDILINKVKDMKSIKL